MQFFFDILFARITLAIVILLSIIYILRKIEQENFNTPRDFIYSLNRFLRKHHITMGVLVIIVGLIHGLLSSDDILTFNLGTCSWLLLILLGASWYYKSKLKRKGWMYYHRILAVFFIGTVSFHVVDVGGFTSDMLSISPAKKPFQDRSNADNSTANESLSAKNIPNAKYKDGVYTGNSTGYRPGLVVRVTISNGTITAITVIAHNERDPKHYSLAMKQVPDKIIQKQSTSVDGVSGATKTSNGIKNAVNDALIKAVKQ